MKKSVLVAGIGGASLGTELLKSLKLCGNYRAFGADISPYAYGLYETGFVKTFVVDPHDYVSHILDICKKQHIDTIVPGGEEPMRLLSQNRDLFEMQGTLLAMNSEQLIELCTDKSKTFEFLRTLGVPVPETRLLHDSQDLGGISYPCVLKPSTRSGGSVFTYLAENAEEATILASYMMKRDITVIAQTYVPHREGEYSVSVLSLPDGRLAGSIAMKRIFISKLSYTTRYNDRVLSSPYSQGLIDDFDQIRTQAENIAQKTDSRGPLNIQGRVLDGIFYPFELNPRFSGGTYLRAMAGFNEVDVFLQFLLMRKRISPRNIRRGYYLRSLEERYVSSREINARFPGRTKTKSPVAAAAR